MSQQTERNESDSSIPDSAVNTARRLQPGNDESSTRRRFKLPVRSLVEPLVALALAFAASAALVPAAAIADRVREVRPATPVATSIPSPITMPATTPMRRYPVVGSPVRRRSTGPPAPNSRIATVSTTTRQVRSRVRAS